MSQGLCHQVGVGEGGGGRGGGGGGRGLQCSVLQEWGHRVGWSDKRGAGVGISRGGSHQGGVTGAMSTRVSVWLMQK